MINTYTNQSNPCEFCIKDTDDSNVAKKEDILEIALSGNDTTLYVRETSVTGCAQLEETHVSFENIPISEDESVKSSIPVESKPEKTTAPAKTTTDQAKIITVNKDLQNLYTKVWSGKTYFEEELRKIRLKAYKNEVSEALKRRRLWKQFQKELRKDKRRDLIISSGPEWWQEPSPKQICLALDLGEIIVADHEEGVTGRTRQWLLDLGVTTRFTPPEVQTCMRKSLLNPIDFLLEVHAVILKSQNVKKSRGDLERPFSINERILLSSVCVLHLPILLTILHYVLPPSKEFSDSEHVQRLLYGDVEDDGVRYATPYMEPLSFRSKQKFQEWAFDRVFMALLPSIWPRIMSKKAPSRVSVESLKLSIASQNTLTEMKKNRRLDSQCSESSLLLLISHCVADRSNRESYVTDDCADIEHSKVFSRRLSKLGQSRTSKHSMSSPKDEEAANSVIFKSVPPSKEGSNQDRADTARPGTKLDTAFYAGSVLSSDDRSNNQDNPQRLGTETFCVASESSSLENRKTDTLLSQASCFRKADKKLSDLKVKLDEEMKNIEKKIEIEDRDEYKLNLPTESIELQNLWKELRNLPEDEQLCHALKVLSSLGDPLAQLPGISKIPSVLRWLEFRKGKNRVLSKETKQALLTSSRGMWQTAPVGWTTDVPKIKCSHREERSLTWNKKKWLESEVKKEVDKFTTRIRQEKVDNARSFFPTMLNHYDYGSRLNRNFREVYFTYLPPREADTFVLRPWKPSD